ncbi:MAG: hypothetical protein U0694_16580 [Anaerolineae bacterium]
MTLSVLEGAITVTRKVTQAVPQGTSTRIPLDENGLAAARQSFRRPMTIQVCGAAHPVAANRNYDSSPSSPP